MNIAILEVIADRIIELLHEHGPLDEAELLDELAADDMDCPADLFERLYSYEGLLPLVRLLDDGRYCAADMILSGRTFTHRLTEAEIAGDYLELDADLHGALNLDEDVRYQHLVDDALFRHVMPRFDGELLADREIAMTPANRSLVLLDFGALEGSQAGELIAVRVTENGFELESIAEAELSEAPAGLQADVLEFVEKHEGRSGRIWEIVMQLCAGDPGLFIDPLRPFGELLAEFGVVVHQDAVARQGYDFEAARRKLAMAAMMIRYEMTEVEAAAVDDFEGLRRALRAAEGTDDTAEARAMALEAARQESVPQLVRIRSPEAGEAIAGALALGGAEEARIQLECGAQGGRRRTTFGAARAGVGFREGAREPRRHARRRTAAERGARRRAAAFGAAEDASWSWLRADDDDAEHLDGTIALADGALAVEAMSGSRIEELLGVLAGVLPDAEVLEQSRTPLNLDALPARAAGVQPELEQDPEMVEFMAQHMREYEQRWLHMELPALDGDTARPAAADPTRREDLQQLLASFDAMPSQPGGMSADRLRVLLGL